MCKETLFIFHMKARSIVHRPGALTTNISVYKNHGFQIILFAYISNNMADSWPLSVNLESMEKNLSS